MKKNYTFKPKSLRKKEKSLDINQELLTALDHLFLTIIRLELDTGQACLLQNAGQPVQQGYEFDWTEYLEFYSNILISDDKVKLIDNFSLSRLLEFWNKREEHYLLDLSCQDEDISLIQINVLFQYEKNQPLAYILTRKHGDNSILQKIIDLYVYNNCDYFIYLDAKNNSYTMFSGSSSGTPLPPAVCSDYSTELVTYAENFVVPEDRQMVIREMQLDRILEVLENHETHSFSCGIWEEGRGYTRKRLEYRYYNRNTHMILLCRTDITELYNEQQQYNQNLQEALKRAQTDSMTNLLNYQGIQDAISNALPCLTQKGAFLFLDMDDFKKINDTFGHDMGDQVLIAVANVLKENIRATDFAGRVGGDEFVIFLNNIPNIKKAEECALRICQQINSLSFGENDISLSSSIGIAMVPDSGTDYITLMKNADQKVYSAKSEGKNRFVL